MAMMDRGAEFASSRFSRKYVLEIHLDRGGNTATTLMIGPRLSESLPRGAARIRTPKLARIDRLLRG
jgi:hypothetical protein